MRPTNKYYAAALLALALSALTAPALAGGPLVDRSHREGLKPARWEGTVKVYTDLGTLGVVDNALANQLVQQFAAAVVVRADVELSRRGRGHGRRPRPRRHHRRECRPASSAPTTAAAST